MGRSAGMGGAGASHPGMMNGPAGPAAARDLGREPMASHPGMMNGMTGGRAAGGMGGGMGGMGGGMGGYGGVRYGGGMPMGGGFGGGGARMGGYGGMPMGGGGFGGMSGGMHVAGMGAATWAAAVVAMAAAGIAKNRVTARRDCRWPAIPTGYSSRDGPDEARVTPQTAPASPGLIRRLLDQDIAQVEGLAGLDGEFLADLGAGLATHGVVDEAIGRAGDQDGKRDPAVGIGGQLGSRS